MVYAAPIVEKDAAPALAAEPGRLVRASARSRLFVFDRRGDCAESMGLPAIRPFIFGSKCLILG